MLQRSMLYLVLVCSAATNATGETSPTRARRSGEAVIFKAVTPVVTAPRETDAEEQIREEPKAQPESVQGSVSSAPRAVLPAQEAAVRRLREVIGTGGSLFVTSDHGKCDRWSFHPKSADEAQTLRTRSAVRDGKAGRVALSATGELSVFDDTGQKRRGGYHLRGAPGGFVFTPRPRDFDGYATRSRLDAFFEEKDCLHVSQVTSAQQPPLAR